MYSGSAVALLPVCNALYFFMRLRVHVLVFTCACVEVVSVLVDVCVIELV